MSGVRVNLHELFKEISRRAPSCRLMLQEVEQHLRQVVRGESTLQEFAEHYCLTDVSPEKRDVT